MRFLEKLKFGKDILKSHLFFNYKVPLSIYLFLTYRCPFRCLYCNITNNTDSKIDMSLDTVLKLINEMALAETKRLHLTGGEPMVRDDIGEIINFAKDKGIFIGLSSSGYYIPKKKDSLRNIDIVFLSLDGEEKIHDYARGKGSYEILMEAIETLKAAKIKFWTTTF